MAGAASIIHGGWREGLIPIILIGLFFIIGIIYIWMGMLNNQWFVFLRFPWWTAVVTSVGAILLIVIWVFILPQY
jgi:hypothetical protein